MANDNISLSEFQKEFILLEYSEIRRQNQSYFEETNNLARYAVIIAGLVWTWLLIQKPPQKVTVIASWLPLLTSILFTLRVITLWLELLHRSTYIKNIEEMLNIPKNLNPNNSKFEFGFEKGLPKNGISWIFLSAATFWTLLIITTLIVPKLLFG
ncbi:hypothetical protein [Nostoc sp. CALU 546]|uniref:hypothetical protein n=1 Tax=Nostoc sp. CALU 546 TaxID=1867241 RepID=UPI003B681801